MKSLGFRGLAVLVIVAGGFIYNFFFVDKDEVITFNDKLVAMIGQNDLRFTEISKQFSFYDEGKTVDVEKLKKLKNKVQMEVKSDLNMLKALEVPEDELCKEFYSSCLGYINNSEKIVEKYTPMISYIATHNPGTEQDSIVITEMISPLLKTDEEIFKKIIAQQTNLSQKFDFKLK